MKLIAKVPCCFAGEKYYPGKEIPEEAVLSPAKQAAMGTIVIVDDPVIAENSSAPFENAGKVNLPVLSENGPTVISVAPESICEAVRIMQLSQTEATSAVKVHEDADALAVLNLCVSNKTILSAVRKRLAELESEEDGGSEGEA